jgi:hypothetical protein
MSDVGWGEVVITRGRYAGRTGYYDDDEPLSNCAVVILGCGLLSATWPVLVQKRSLRAATDLEVRRWHREHGCGWGRVR